MIKSEGLQFFFLSYCLESSKKTFVPQKYIFCYRDTFFNVCICVDEYSATPKVQRPHDSSSTHNFGSHRNETQFQLIQSYWRNKNAPEFVEKMEEFTALRYGNALMVRHAKFLSSLIVIVADYSVLCKNSKAY